MSKNKKNIFETWMMQESDSIQSLSKTYSEYEVVKEFNKQIKLIDDSNMKNVLTELFLLYSYSKIKEDTVFFSLNNILSKSTLSKINSKIIDLNKSLGAKSLDLVNSFGIPDWMIHSPMANNWEEYNKYQNSGELENKSYKD